jgi:protein SCO1/2
MNQPTATTPTSTSATAHRVGPGQAGGQRNGLPHALGAAWAVAIALGLTLAAVTTGAGAHEAHNHDVAAGLTRSEHPYTMPALKVTRNDGKRMTLAEALDDGRPVMLNFIYTSCNAICPVTSQVFVEFRERIGATRDKINMVSISIDPEQDTPRKLTEYAARFGGAGTWAHYTSSTAGAVEIQRAFGVWRGDKMNHQPTTFLRAAPGKPWVRLDGFIGPTALVDEYRKSF